MSPAAVFPAESDEPELSLAVDDADELMSDAEELVSDADEVDELSDELDDDPPEQAVMATAARTATSDVVSKRSMYYFSFD